ncbi:hypothetical protein MJO47_07190 [Desulfuromonas sp. KJ2020]|uniref:hypothetical protein n=1 Tax=Desulfuromonas sp. KJ2020 TaxID=2919173 RepID=UPI0020A778F9|nr:hypothetical protein [Desulfuromonas sp. KJ2020]MCP3176886.1 hypothetical protein [Desulfuromonas sp. KJ2020]
MRQSLSEFTAERIARRNESAYPALMTIAMLIKVGAIIGGILGVVVGARMFFEAEMPGTQQAGLLVIFGSFFSALFTYGYAEILNATRDTAMNTEASVDYLAAVLTHMERGGAKDKPDVSDDFTLGRIPAGKTSQQNRPNQK